MTKIDHKTGIFQLPTHVATLSSKAVRGMGNAVKSAFMAVGSVFAAFARMIGTGCSALKNRVSRTLAACAGKAQGIFRRAHPVPKNEPVPGKDNTPVPVAPPKTPVATPALEEKNLEVSPVAIPEHLSELFDNLNLLLLKQWGQLSNKDQESIISRVDTAMKNVGPDVNPEDIGLATLVDAITHAQVVKA